MPAQRLKEYQTENLEYKDQARKILIQELGYEPPVTLSALSELTIRDKLKKIDMNEELYKPFDEWVDFQVRFINRLMMEHVEAYNC